MQKLVLSLAVCLLSVPFAFGQNNAKLKGDFPFNETLHIVQQPAVGGQCGPSLVGPVSTAIYNDQGIWSFDGKGNVHMTDSGTFMTVSTPSDASQVVPGAAECFGTNLGQQHGGFSLQVFAGSFCKLFPGPHDRQIYEYQHPRRRLGQA